MKLLCCVVVQWRWNVNLRLDFSFVSPRLQYSERVMFLSSLRAWCLQKLLPIQLFHWSIDGLLQIPIDVIVNYCILSLN